MKKPGNAVGSAGRRPSPIAAKDLAAGQEGIALLLCMFSLLLLTGIALGLIYMGDTETRVNDNFRSSQQAYFAARAGLEEARDRMRTAALCPAGMCSSYSAAPLVPVCSGFTASVLPWTTNSWKASFTYGEGLGTFQSFSALLSFSVNSKRGEPSQ